MRYLLCLLTLAALVRADEDPEVRFLQAWFAMSEPGKAPAAEETFRALYGAADTPKELKARCLLALAECARIAGDAAKERNLLEQVVAEYDGTGAAERARQRLGEGDWIDAIRFVPKGWYLDLDDGTVSETRQPVRRKEAEMLDGRLLVEALPDAEMATKAAPVSTKPWQRVVTSEGRQSWVQILQEEADDRRGRNTAVRIVTRLRGVGEILGAPGDPFCIGGSEGIEVHFVASRLFARYRIERSAGEGKPVEFQAVESPFLDKTAERGVRYLYRIAGETEGGSLGLAATLEGTLESRGVVSGVAQLDRGEAKSFDFLLGEVVPEGGDITLTGTYGGRSSASFTDAFGRQVLAIAPALEALQSPWAGESQGTDQIEPGSVFVVALRGGGVARCRLELPESDRAGDPEAILHYDACGDGAFLPMPVRLDARRGEDGAVVTVQVEPPYRVEEVEVIDLVAGHALTPLGVKDGVARDPSAREGAVREYRAVGIDRHGRRSVASTTILALFPDRPRAGEFRFRHQQGYSIETGRIVPADQADVLFERCAGGITSITLAAPGGITSLERTLPREIDPGTARAIFDLLLRADPQIELGRQAEARTPASDVLLLRTRHGGWAKLAIIHRESDGASGEDVATVTYVFNGREPVFGQGDGETLGGITFADLKPLRARAQILERWLKGWQEIVQDPVRRKALEGEPREEGVMPDPATTQEVLWSRQRHRDYEKATFNFAYGIRDDPDRALVRNDWCLQYGNGGDTLDVRMVTDDLSTITDLGRVEWNRLARRKAIEERDASRAPARVDHIYLVHTFDTDENFFALFRVTALRPGDQVAFEWISFRDEAVARSPGLALEGATEAALKALVATLPATPEKRWEGREAARAVRMRLDQPEVRVGVVEAELSAFLRELGEVTGIRFAVNADRPGAISLFSARLTPVGILDAVCDQAGLRWQIEDDGTVSLGRD